jgi:hypothetical protein
MNSPRKESATLFSDVQILSFYQEKASTMLAMQIPVRNQATAMSGNRRASTG